MDWTKDDAIISQGCWCRYMVLGLHLYVSHAENRYSPSREETIRVTAHWPTHLLYYPLCCHDHTNITKTHMENIENTYLTSSFWNDRVYEKKKCFAWAPVAHIWQNTLKNNFLYGWASRYEVLSKAWRRANHYIAKITHNNPSLNDNTLSGTCIGNSILVTGQFCSLMSYWHLVCEL